MTTLRCSLLAALLATAAAPAAAQPGPPPAPATRAQAHDRVRMMYMWRLTEALRLDEPTAARLFPLLGRIEERKAPVRKELGDLARQLRAEAENPKANPAQIGQLIDRIVAARDRLRQLENDGFKEIRRVLSPVQQARLVLLMPRLDRQVRGLVERAQRRRGPDWQDDL